MASAVRFGERGMVLILTRGIMILSKAHARASSVRSGVDDRTGRKSVHFGSSMMGWADAVVHE